MNKREKDALSLGVVAVLLILGFFSFIEALKIVGAAAHILIIVFLVATLFGYFRPNLAETIRMVVKTSIIIFLDETPEEEDE